MKYLLISDKGQGGPLAYQLQQQGQRALMWTRIKDRYGSNYNNIIPKVPKWDEALEPSTIILFDSLGGGKTAARLGTQRYIVVGASPLADALTQDLFLRRHLLMRHQLETPPHLRIEMWFDGRRFLKPAFKTVELYRLMNNDLGPAGPPVATLTWASVDERLLVLEDTLANQGYIGFVGLQGSELRFDLGRESTLTSLLLIQGGAEALFSQLLFTELKHLTVRGGFAASLRVSIPPFPQDVECERDVMLDCDTTQVWPHNVYEASDLWWSSGAHSSMCSFWGLGASISEAFIGPLTSAASATLKDKQYRTDVVGRFQELMEGEEGHELANLKRTLQQVASDVSDPGNIRARAAFSQRSGDEGA